MRIENILVQLKNSFSFVQECMLCGMIFISSKDKKVCFNCKLQSISSTKIK